MRRESEMRELLSFLSLSSNLGNDEKVNNAVLLHSRFNLTNQKRRGRNKLFPLCRSLSFSFSLYICITPWPSTRRAPRRRRLPPSAQSAVGSKARRFMSSWLDSTSVDIFAVALFPSPHPRALPSLSPSRRIPPLQKSSQCGLLLVLLSLARRWRRSRPAGARAPRRRFSPLLAAAVSSSSLPPMRRSPPPPLLPPSGGRTAPRCA